MKTPSAVSPPSTDVPLRAAAWDIALNALVPFALYQFSKHFISPSEFDALIVAALFPLGKSVYDLVRRHELDPVAIIILLGIVTDGIAIGLGGSVRLLLVRESIFTGAFGVACLVSLLLPRPLMFYFGRYFFAGSDPGRRARYNISWQFPDVRLAARLVTAVWGVVLVGELCVRLALIAWLTPALVLVVSPILLGASTVATLVWSFRYGHRKRAQAVERMDQMGV